MNSQNKQKINEIAEKVVKGSISQIPYVGPFLAEWMPNRQVERIEKLILWSVAKTEGFTPERLQERLKDKEFADLFEQSIFDASKALSDERLKCIASIVSHGVKDDSNKLVLQKCLTVLKDLDDFEIVVFNTVAALSKKKHQSSNYEQITLQVFKWDIDEKDFYTETDTEYTNIVVYSMERLKNFNLIQLGDERQYSLTLRGTELYTYIKGVID